MKCIYKCLLNGDSDALLVLALAAAATAASYSFNTPLPQWRPFKWDVRFVVLKLAAFFTALRILAEHALQTAMALSSAATEKNIQTGEDMVVTCWHSFPVTETPGRARVRPVRRSRWWHEHDTAGFKRCYLPARNFMNSNSLLYRIYLI